MGFNENNENKHFLTNMERDLLMLKFREIQLVFQFELKCENIDMNIFLNKYSTFSYVY